MNIKSHSFEEIWSSIKSGAKIIDVRTESEFLEGHLEGAQNIAHDQLESHLQELESYKQKDLIVYCKSGGRSDFAMKLLNANGFENVINAGGYSEIVRNKN
jgi:phage shock protein E